MAGTHLPIGPTAYRNLVTRPTQPYQTTSNEALYVALLFQSKAVSVCTSGIVFMVVYEFRYVVEGISFSQEELSGVTYFDLVMLNIPVTTADKHKNTKTEVKSSVYR